jgi:hypothetical protein
MKKLENFLAGMIIGGLICVVLFALTSCSGSRGGYGCKGNQSWNKMVWRNNRP